MTYLAHTLFSSPPSLLLATCVVRDLELGPTSHRYQNQYTTEGERGGVNRTNQPQISKPMHHRGGERGVNRTNQPQISKPIHHRRGEMGVNRTNQLLYHLPSFLNLTIFTISHLSSLKSSSPSPIFPPLNHLHHLSSFILKPSSQTLSFNIHFILSFLLQSIFTISQIFLLQKTVNIFLIFLLFYHHHHLSYFLLSTILQLSSFHKSSPSLIFPPFNHLHRLLASYTPNNTHHLSSSASLPFKFYIFSTIIMSATN